MTDPAGRPRRMSVAAYLAREERATERHEYVAGVVYALSGGTLRHNTIAGNIFAKLRAAADGGPCRVFVNDVKVRVADDVFYYPDVVVACGALDDSAVYLHEPSVIVEVASPSTASTDRREKLLAYRQLPSLRLYLVVEQRRHSVLVHARDARGAWRSDRVRGSGAIDVPCPATTLTRDEIYAGVTLPAVSEPTAGAYRA